MGSVVGRFARSADGPRTVGALPEDAAVGAVESLQPIASTVTDTVTIEWISVRRIMRVSRVGSVRCFGALNDGRLYCWRLLCTERARCGFTHWMLHATSGQSGATSGARQRIASACRDQNRF